MLSIDRRKYILERMKEFGSGKIEDLAEELKVSQMTIRRDLDKLEAEDLLERTHGGAILTSCLYNAEDYEIKKEKNIDVKRRIAKAASELVEDFSTVLIDAGTTTFELANILSNRKGLVIITGDLKIASLMCKSNNDVHFIGGKLEKNTESILSAECNDFLEKINIDYAFIGGSAVSNHRYLTTPTFEKAALKTRILNVAEKSVLLIDKSKFETKSFVKIVPLTDFDVIITDEEFDEDLLVEFANANVEITLI